MLSLITVPSATTILTGVSDYSSSIFTDLLNVAYMAAGFLIGAAVLAFMLGVVVRATKKITGGRGRRRGRR